LIPTIDISSSIFRQVVKTYRDAEKDKKQGKNDKILYDKEFLLFAPYLYETGLETIPELRKKFNIIKGNEKLHKRYLEIINNLELDNLDYVEIKHTCGSLEEASIRFPGGWKKLFISTKDDTGYFS
jgi:hypothetical protein